MRVASSYNLIFYILLASFHQLEILLLAIIMILALLLLTWGWSRARQINLCSSCGSSLVLLLVAWLLAGQGGCGRNNWTAGGEATPIFSSLSINRHAPTQQAILASLLLPLSCWFTSLLLLVILRSAGSRKCEMWSVDVLSKMQILILIL